MKKSKNFNHSLKNGSDVLAISNSQLCFKIYLLSDCFVSGTSTWKTTTSSCRAQKSFCGLLKLFHPIINRFVTCLVVKAYMLPYILNILSKYSTFPGIDSCLMVTKWDFLEMEASLWLNGRSQNVAKGCLSTECCWEAAVHTLDLSWKKMDVKLMMMMMMMISVSLYLNKFAWYHCFDLEL